MFIGKNTLPLTYDSTNLSPAVNIETLYFEQIDKVRDTSDGADLYHVYKRAVHKHMPIQYYHTNNVYESISIGESDYEFQDIQYGISYDKLRDPRNNYGYTTENSFDESDRHEIVGSDTSIYMFKATDTYFNNGNVTLLKVDFSDKYNLSEILKHFLTKSKFEDASCGLSNDMQDFTDELISRTEERKETYWDPSIDNMWLHLYGVIDYIEEPINASIKLLEDPINEFVERKLTYIVARVILSKMSVAHELVTDAYYLTSIKNGYYVLLHAINDHLVSSHAVFARTIHVKDAETGKLPTTTTKYYTITLDGELTLDIEYDENGCLPSNANKYDIVYMHDTINNINALFDFISTNLIDSTCKNVSIFSKLTGISTIRNSKNLYIGADCQRIEVLNSFDTYIDAGNNKLIISNSSCLTIGTNNSSIVINDSKFVNILNLNSSILVVNTETLEIDNECTNILIGETIQEPSNKGNIIYSGNSSIYVTGCSNTIYLHNKDITLKDVSHNIVYLNNNSIDCVSTYSMTLTLGGKNEKYDERNNLNIIINGSIYDAGLQAINPEHDNFREVFVKAAYNSAMAPFYIAPTISTSVGPAYVLHLMSENDNSLAFDNFILMTTDNTYDATYIDDISTWKCHYWLDGEKETPSDTGYPKIYTKTLLMPGISSGGGVMIYDNNKDHVSKVMTLDLLYDKAERMHKYINYTVSPYITPVGVKVYDLIDDNTKIHLLTTTNADGTHIVNIGATYEIDQDTSVVYCVVSRRNGQLLYQYYGYELLAKDIDTMFIYNNLMCSALHINKGMSVEAHPELDNYATLTFSNDTGILYDSFTPAIEYNMPLDRQYYSDNGATKYNSRFCLNDINDNTISNTTIYTNMFKNDLKTVYEVIVTHLKKSRSDQWVSGEYNGKCYIGSNNTYNYYYVFNNTTGKYDRSDNQLNLYEFDNLLYLDNVNANSAQDSMINYYYVKKSIDDIPTSERPAILPTDNYMYILHDITASLTEKMSFKVKLRPTEGSNSSLNTGPDITDGDNTIL